jgi:thioredoxin-related protein
LNIQDPEGRKAASRFRLRFTPTFALFDGSGQELWRTVGALDPGMVRKSLGSP